ncbi:MAG: hypothetical protein KAJ33_04475, partial [Thermoplasmata archaeon]|nr:hypothetical protein [Thermoplasmata archaeon]
MGKMIFEPKELYACSPPWISESKRSGRAVLIIGILIIIASVLGLLAFNGDFDDESAVGVAGFIICFPFGLVFLAVGVYFLRDMKDNWILILPYNRLLFEKLHSGSKEMLASNSYIYEKNKSIKIYNYEIDRKTKNPYARSYEINTRFASNIVYEYGLV